MSTEIEVLHFTEKNSWDTEVVEYSKKAPVIIDFFATWCPPCRKLGPLVEKLGKEGIKCVKVDVDQNQPLAKQFNVSSIPYVMLFHNGEKAKEFVGYDEEKLNEFADYCRKNTPK